MDSETFNQKCGELMELTATAFFTTISDIVVSSLKLDGIILEFTGDAVAKYAMSGMTDLANHVDDDWHGPGVYAHYCDCAVALGRNFKAMLNVQRQWKELCGSCDGPEEFAGKFYDYTTQLAAFAS
jgi:hypothetical protein